MKIVAERAVSRMSGMSWVNTSLGKNCWLAAGLVWHPGAAYTGAAVSSGRGNPEYNLHLHLQGKG